MKLPAELYPNRYVIWIGNPSARKNPELLCEAFRVHLQSYPDHRLVIVAPLHAHSTVRRMATSRGIEGALTLLAPVSEEVRDALYRSALALVFPSRCEGFGYPIVEAMAQGCPPIALEDGPARELVGDLVSLPQREDANLFAGVISIYAEQPRESREILSRALADRAGLFSTARMATETLRVLLDGLSQEGVITSGHASPSP